MAKLQPRDERLRELRTTREACALLGCSRSTLLKLVKQGRLQRVRYIGQFRFTVRDLNALVDEILAADKDPDAAARARLR